MSLLRYLEFTPPSPFILALREMRRQIRQRDKPPKDKRTQKYHYWIYRKKFLEIMNRAKNFKPRLTDTISDNEVETVVDAIYSYYVWRAMERDEEPISHLGVGADVAYLRHCMTNYDDFLLILGETEFIPYAGTFFDKTLYEIKQSLYSSFHSQFNCLVVCSYYNVLKEFVER